MTIGQHQMYVHLTLKPQAFR